EGSVALDDEDWMSTDHDRQRDAGLVCDGRRPESRRVDDYWCVDVLARRGVDAGDAARRAANRHHLDTLLDAHTAAARRIRVAVRHRGRIAVARVGLVEDRAKILGI